MEYSLQMLLEAMSVAACAEEEKWEGVKLVSECSIGVHSRLSL